MTTIKNEVAEFLQRRGTPATPKHIAKEIGRGTAGNIARALRDLTNEGKLIRTTRPVQNGWVTYEWNPYWKGKEFAPQFVPLNQPKPEEKSELRKVFEKWCENDAVDYDMFKAIITEIEKLQKPQEKPVDASKRSGEVWVNVYPNCGWVHACATKAEAGTYATETRLACVRVPWVEGEGL